MYKALVFTLFISTAYVQCAPQEIAEEHQEKEYQTFCDLDSSRQVSFLKCVQEKSLLFKEYLEKKSTTVDDFLAEICKDGELDYPEELMAALESEWDKIEECIFSMEEQSAA